MADLPKTYKLTNRYREGAKWSTMYKGVRVEFILGPVIKRKSRPGLCDEVICKVIPL